MKKSIDSIKELTKKDCNAGNRGINIKMLPKTLTVIKTTLFAQKTFNICSTKEKISNNCNKKITLSYIIKLVVFHVKQKAIYLK